MKHSDCDIPTPLPPQFIWSELQGLLQHSQVCRQGQTNQEYKVQTNRRTDTHTSLQPMTCLSHSLNSHVSVVPRLSSLSLCSAAPTSLPSWCVQVVRNVLTVDYHMSRYKTVVEELQREIAELKARLAQQGPLKSQFDKTEAAR